VSPKIYDFENASNERGVYLEYCVLNVKRDCGSDTTANVNKDSEIVTILLPEHIQLSSTLAVVTLTTFKMITIMMLVINYFR